MGLAQRDTSESWRTMTGEHRVFTRVPFSHAARWMNGAKGDEGVAAIRDVSRSGLGMSLGRFLRPGPVLRVVFDDIEFDGSPIEVQAITVWCRPDSAQAGRFLAGFSIVQGERQTLGAMSEVFYAAIRQYAAIHQIR